MMRRATISCLFATFALLACGPPKGDVPRDLEAEALRFAEATCAARQTCGCEGDGRYDSAADCEADLVARFLDQVDAGLTFDPVCFDIVMASEAMTCAPWPYESYHPADCAVLQGQGQEGDPCESHDELLPLRASDCVEGLKCTLGSCARDYANQSEGEPCKDETVNTCGTGLWCGPDETCHPQVALGEPCTNWRACGLGSYCEGLGADGAGVCAEYLTAGETCDPRDRDACLLPPWSWCAPSETGAYTCQEDIPGICNLTFTP